MFISYLELPFSELLLGPFFYYVVFFSFNQRVALILYIEIEAL